MRVGFMGGVPPALGGGGLELQMRRTADALRRRGHVVERVESADAGSEWDVVHAFGAEGNVQHMLTHWTRATAPLVLSPVVVASPGRDELALAVFSRVPVGGTSARLRRRAMERADVVIAITRYESRVIRHVIGARAHVAVVPNGVDPVTPAEPTGRAPGYALLLGAVSRRKRTVEALEALDGSGAIVLAGAFADAPAERNRFDAALRRTGGEWLGPVSGEADVARLLVDAGALVHVSRAEVQSLAVLEALRLATPVILSDIPSHRELAGRYPGHVRLVRALSELPGALAGARAWRPAAPAGVPGWGEVATALESIYERVIERAPGPRAGRTAASL